MRLYNAHNLAVAAAALFLLPGRRDGERGGARLRTRAASPSPSRATHGPTRCPSPTSTGPGPARGATPVIADCRVPIVKPSARRSASAVLLSSRPSPPQGSRTGSPSQRAGREGKKGGRGFIGEAMPHANLAPRTSRLVPFSRFRAGPFRPRIQVPPPRLDGARPGSDPFAEGRVSSVECQVRNGA